MTVLNLCRFAQSWNLFLSNVSTGLITASAKVNEHIYKVFGAVKSRFVNKKTCENMIVETDTNWAC